MTAYGAAVVLSILAGGSPASVASPAHSPQVIDYAFAFAKASPVSGTEHRIADWSHATIAPSCPSALSHGFQITAGCSSRFKCWPTEYTTRCGWALPDMPAALKSVVENEYPASMAVRWRWRGLGGVLRTRYVDAERNRVALRDGVSVTVPGELGLEFVDAGGHVVWTASAAMPAGKAGHGSASRR